MNEQTIRTVLSDHGVFIVSFKDDKAKIERDSVRLARELQALYQKELEATIQKVRMLFWFDDDCKTAGTLVTGSVIYSELRALEGKGDENEV